MKKINEKQQPQKSPSDSPMTMDEFLGVSGATQTTQPTQQTKPALPPKPRKSRVGSLNPFHDHKHSAESKAKMSNTQKARYQAMRANLTKEARTDNLRALVREEVERYLKVALN